MRLHNSVIEKLLYIVQNYGGHEHDTKLRAKLQELDLTPYERRAGTQEVILVLTEDYMKQLAGTAGR
jgi:hypothetical protein